MSKMPKKILIFAFCFIFHALTVNAFDSIIVGTGDDQSASWRFTLNLSENWKARYLDSRKVIKRLNPENNGTFQNRFRALEKGYLPLIIAPVKFLSQNQLTEKKIRLLSVLWETYLAPLSDQPVTQTVRDDSFSYWFSPAKTVIANDLLKNEPWQNFQLSPSAATAFASVEIEETSNDALKLTTEPKLPSFRQLILVEPKNYPTIQTHYQNFVIFHDMVGSISNLQQAYELKLNVLSLDQQLLKKLQQQLSWLDFLTVNIPEQKKIQTIGFQMGLFCREDLDEETAKKILTILKQPLIATYLMTHLNIQNTGKQPNSILHAESISFFK